MCARRRKSLIIGHKECIDWLMNATVKDCFENIRNLQYERGLALTDIVREISPWITKLKIPPSSVFAG